MKNWLHQALPENVSGSIQCVSSPRSRESFPKFSQLFKCQVLIFARSVDVPGPLAEGTLLALPATSGIVLWVHPSLVLNRSRVVRFPYVCQISFSLERLHLLYNSSQLAHHLKICHAYGKKGVKVSQGWLLLWLPMVSKRVAGRQLPKVCHWTHSGGVVFEPLLSAKRIARKHLQADLYQPFNRSKYKILIEELLHGHHGALGTSAPQISKQVLHSCLEMDFQHVLKGHVT